MYIEMWEFENLQEMEKCSTRIFEDDGMKRIQEEFHTLIDHRIFAGHVWNTVAQFGFGINV